MSISQNFFNGRELDIYDRRTTQMMSVLTDPIIDILKVWFDSSLMGKSEKRYRVLLSLPFVKEVSKRWNYQYNFKVTPGTHKHTPTPTHTLTHTHAHTHIHSHTHTHPGTHKHTLTHTLIL
jgi:hypothetical protein